MFWNIELAFHTSFGFAINLFAILHLWKSWTSQQHNWYNCIFWNNMIQKIGCFALKIPSNLFVFYYQMKQKQMDVCIENTIQFFCVLWPNEIKTIGCLYWKYHPIFVCFMTKWNQNNWMFVLKISSNFYFIFWPNETKIIGWNFQY